MTTYRDRQTGRMVHEVVFGGDAIRWFYTAGAGRTVFDLVINRAWFCHLYGRAQDSRGSARRIPEFVKRFGIVTEDCERPWYTYRSFNDFFSRRLKPEARPFAPEPERFCAPAEGKVLVVPRLAHHARLAIKGSFVGVEALLGSRASDAPYHGGAALLVRLAPYDYHRFHFSVAGNAGPARDVPGRYHSVNPLAMARVPDLYGRNKRTVTVVETPTFGNIAYVEVGALCVGTIVQTYQPGPVDRGDEKGYFRFGGSTLVLLFEPGRIVFDEDLVADSEAGVEVQVRVGSSIGRMP